MAPNTTAQATVATGDFTAETRKHPAFAFIEESRTFFDSRDLSALPDWFTPDMTVRTPDAAHMAHDPSQADRTVHGHGHDHALARGTHKFYAEPLAEHHHIPACLVAVENGEGYDLHSQWHLYANVAGKRGAGEAPKVKDEEGKEWDVMIPVFYEFNIVKVPDSKFGYKIKHINVVKDTGVVNDILDSRDHSHKRSKNV